MSELPKITPVHLGRDAYVYVRQSTITQVREHTQSLQRQYELVERAAQLGWLAHQVLVIDEDLGRSGADASAREGFKGLAADVGLGKVGLILGIEVSRLARNNADWYHLLDLCALTDTLIADGDGVYHPGVQRPARARPQRHDERCDARAHVASELADWRIDVEGVVPDQCPRSVPTLTCVAGNRGVRSSGGQAQGRPLHPSATGEGEDWTGERE